MDNTPKGQSAERTTTGNKNEPGIYLLKRSGTTDVESITSGGVEGAIQADALARVGFVRTGNVPSREELLERNKKALADEEAAEKTPETISGEPDKRFSSNK